MTIHLTPSDYGAILPEIITVVGALLLLLLDVFVPGRSEEQGSASTEVATEGAGSTSARAIPNKTVITTAASLLTVVLAFAASVHLWVVGGGPVFPHAYPMVTGDRFAQFFNFALLASAALSILIAPRFLEHSDFDSGEFFALMLFAVTGMMLLAAGINLMVLFLAIELLSLSLYILSGFNRSKPRSQESGFKYFLLSSFASAFLIYGMAFIYGATGSTNLSRIAGAVSTGVGGAISGAGVDASPFLLAGIGLMAVGFAFKLSVVPFHMWTPDVYEGAPTPVTAFMSVATKAAVFAAFIRVFNFSLGSVSSKWFGIVWALAIATMIVGNVLALSQGNMKRLLAYSGIAHAGYALVALSSTNTLGLTAVAFYFIVYAFMNIGAFVLVLVLENQGEAGEEISSYRGLFTRSPWLAIATGIFMFSLAGFPPTAGFFAKYYAFAAAVQAGHTDLAVIGVITSVVSLGYYLRVVMLMFMEPATAGARRVVPTWTSGIALTGCVAGVFIIGVVPWFYNLASQAVRAFA